MSKRNRRKKQKRKRNRQSAPVATLAKESTTQANSHDSTRSEWAGPSGQIGVYIAEQSKNTLEAYRNQPILVAEHANHEQDTARGGYARRQLFELVQNAADALASSSGGRIELRLTSDYLYCADNGRAIDEDGVKALMFSHLSPKRGTAEIGRFGLGFKSVLGVTNAPEFFSRSGSLRFDGERAREEIRRVVPDAELYPSLRLPLAIDPRPEKGTDPVLCGLMDWATNIVRLPLKPGAHGSLVGQAEDFPSQFLLFVEHVSELDIQIDGVGDSQELARSFRLQLEDESLVAESGENNPRWMTLMDGDQESRWMLVRDTHELSEDARADSRSLDDATEVEIKWAAPVDRLNEPGCFWAFFPTQTQSLLRGILNAPWKTNEDRQNLLPGIYNDELIDAAAAMVAKHLTNLSTREDPARHLDALPRRAEAGDAGPSRRLRSQLHSNLLDGEIVPNQAGQLHKPTVLNYAPREITNPRQEAPLLRWQAYEGRPDNWAHDSVLTRERLATVRRLLPVKVTQRSYRGTFTIQEGLEELPIAELGEWLEALVDDINTLEEALKASMAAIQTAALISEDLRQDEFLGDIVLATDGSWVAPDPDAVFLGGGLNSTAFSLVHPQLEADADTLSGLKALGIGPASAESAFRDVAGRLLVYSHYREVKPLDNEWREFWQLSLDVEPNAATEIIKAHENWNSSLRVLTVSGKWRSLLHTLFPGSIVPENGSRDAAVATDMRFHQANQLLLRLLGAVESPTGGRELSPAHMRRFLRKCRITFTDFAQREVRRTPRDYMLNFEPPATTSGPLDVLELLSDDGKAEYTWRLLSLHHTFTRWTMRHDTQEIYPPISFNSPALEILQEHGRISTDEGIGPFSDGIGDSPKNPAVLHKLLIAPPGRPDTQSLRLAGRRGHTSRSRWARIFPYLYSTSGPALSPICQPNEAISNWCAATAFAPSAEMSRSASYGEVSCMWLASTRRSMSLGPCWMN